MKEFIVVKKNRKYFAAKHKGYDCKILIDEQSKDLELGTHQLDVEDISVRTKYGTDLKFKLKSELKAQKSAGIVTLESPYNSYLVAECRSHGGTWDSSAKVWVFTALISDEIDQLDHIFNSPLIPIEVTVKEDIFACRSSVTCLGYRIATATGRDSGATIADEIGVISGHFGSGGSMKNWSTYVDEGTVFRFEVSEEVYLRYKDAEDEQFSFTVFQPKESPVVEEA